MADEKGYGIFGESTLEAHVAETCNVEFLVKDEKTLKMYAGKGHTGFTGNCVEMLAEKWRFDGVRINEFGRIEATFTRK